MPKRGSFRTTIEPFRIETVEPIRMTTPVVRRVHRVEGVERTLQRRDAIAGLRSVYQKPPLRHVTARFRRLPRPSGVTAS